MVTDLGATVMGTPGLVFDYPLIVLSLEINKQKRSWDIFI
jgi:hypothetical protein